MASKKALEVVKDCPQETAPSIEEILGDRLAEDIAAEVDIAKVAKFAFKKLGSIFKAKLIEFIVADFAAPSVALNEIEAAALPSSDEDKAA
ncbi:MAG: hypothetical protein NW214_04140 [Pseudanabaenaceae cyanobacterium bins.39]|nr:hypothetical protein [Pseudanabaenaceae cyanobacterium bins.39]